MQYQAGREKRGVLNRAGFVPVWSDYRVYVARRKRDEHQSQTERAENCTRGYMIVDASSLYIECPTLNRSDLFKRATSPINDVR